MKILETLSGWVWGPLMISLLVGTGIYLTIRLRLIQLFKLSTAFKLVTGKYDSDEDSGEITHFQALSAALSATIGTGNIAGVATAIFSGGPGAVFWMWITAFFGMATKYTSCLLSLKFREVHQDGSVSGGPMYTIEKGLNNKALALSFAIFTCIASLGIGNMVQANSVVDPLATELGPLIAAGTGVSLRSAVLFVKSGMGILMAVLTGLVIIGGIKRIARVASRIVPFMSVVYILGSLIILVIHIGKIPGVITLILKHAFSSYAVAGGVAGYTVRQAIRFGVARGVFSNESGLGSAPMAHAAARTKYPVREGLVAMLGPFIDTIIICSMTAFVILVTGVWKTAGVSGAALSMRAFQAGLPAGGKWIVIFGIIFFAFSTMISWSYYGDRSCEYIFGSDSVRVYRWIYVLAIPVGALVKLDLVWMLSDITNGLMAIPNLISLLLLSGLVIKETRNYFSKTYDIS